MKLLQEVLDWNRMSGANKMPQKPRSHKGGKFTVSLGFHPDASPEDIQGEIEDLQMKIDEMIDEAIEGNYTLITGVSFK